MRLSRSSPTPVGHHDPARQQRAAAGTLRSTFPGVDHIRVSLSFRDSGPPPADQAHTMHAAARAFFDFPCPYANCDGRISLNENVERLIRQHSLQLAGTLECHGARGAMTKQTCGLQVSYVISVQYVDESSA